MEPMHKALSLLSLARRGRRIEVGEEPVSAVTRAGKARLVLVASDASEHTLRRAKAFVAGTEQPIVRLPFDKDALGRAVGRTAVAVAALTDAALAVAFVKALDEPDPALLAQLERKSERLRQRQREQQAHRDNIRRGKKKPK